MYIYIVMLPDCRADVVFLAQLRGNIILVAKWSWRTLCKLIKRQIPALLTCHHIFHILNLDLFKGSIKMQIRSRGIQHNKGTCLSRSSCVAAGRLCASSQPSTILMLWWGDSLVPLFSQRWRCFGFGVSGFLCTSAAEMVQLPRWRLAASVSFGEPRSETGVKVLIWPVDPRYHHHFLPWASITSDTVDTSTELQINQ